MVPFHVYLALIVAFIITLLVLLVIAWFAHRLLPRAPEALPEPRTGPDYPVAEERY